MSQLSEISAQELMIRQQIIDRGINDLRIIEALRSVPREKFFPAESRQSAYADRAAPIGHDQTISQPYMVALMTARLDVQPIHRVLEIGTGSGYQTALLGRLAAEVYTVERIKPLLDEAWERLMSLDIRNVHYRFGDGTAGWPEFAPFDRILITAGAPSVPKRLLLSQLVDGGIAVFPVGDQDEQMLVEIRRSGDRLDSADICPCRFVKLIGQEGWSQQSE
jgi:protein-L-isoaspartate(D-aspartate) O-methyltransferase